MDVGVYNLSYTTFILGNAPEFISGSLYIGETGVDENVSINLAYPGGKQAQLYGDLYLRLIVSDINLDFHFVFPFFTYLPFHKL